MTTKPGESAQREYDRRRAKDLDRRRRHWKRSLLVVVLTFPLTYGFVQGAAWAINDWIVPRFLDGLTESIAETQDSADEQPTSPSAPEAPVTDAGSGTDGAGSTDAEKEPTISSKLANQFGLVFAALATLSVAKSAWGRRQSTEAWAKGAAGERATGTALDALPPGFVALHDLKMPGSRGNIDHLVVGPTGAFTVETKNYEAGVVLKSGKATRAGRSLDTVIDQATRQAEAMTYALDLDVRAIVCVHGGPVRIQGFFQKPTVSGVRFCSGKNLARLLAKGPTVLSPEQITKATGIAPAPVGAKVPKAPAAPAQTRKQARRESPPLPTVRPPEVSTPTPPMPPPPAPATQTCRCGAAMVLRQRRSDGNAFLGCSTFPKCRHTIPA